MCRWYLDGRFCMGWLVNGEAIYGTRPWKVFGEAVREPASAKGDKRRHSVSSSGIRSTRSSDGKYVYAIPLECPPTTVQIKSLKDGDVHSVELLGSQEKLTWETDGRGVLVNLPTSKPCGHAYALRAKVQ